mmetsp:Transcript_7611/g.11411  ORF Transcript_7611/g.11411 Transcript_7611/m.11411 type:complete len:200 (-) Transcript_7611:72-671(-)|eukprot:CAMPEP_0171479126 /NCGR_PEP_ID=MMETSP0946-20130122/5207_1 /TAXON_ID=109269 /ORGANISM="Vaucheria litorea, Strain CCMP2940" /LENGTH=199 /DNA_ID=CAMNT_0012009933 /DNA_START=123 /DNA_END=722 /DNA_ORIENTATION=-
MNEAIFSCFRNKDSSLLWKELCGSNFDEINAQYANGTTPLMAASFCGDDEVVKNLLIQGADPSIKDQFGNTAVSFAEMNSHNEIAAKLKRSIKLGKDHRKIFPDVLCVDQLGIVHQDLVDDTQGSPMEDTIPILHFVKAKKPNENNSVSIKFDQDPKNNGAISEEKDFSNCNEEKDGDSDTSDDGADYWEHLKEKLDDN